MRDPTRIDPIIERLRAYWHAHPDLRLGQIVMNALRGARGEVSALHAFNAEDSEFLARLEEMDAAPRGEKARGR